MIWSMLPWWGKMMVVFLLLGLTVTALRAIGELRLSRQRLVTAIGTVRREWYALTNCISCGDAAQSVRGRFCTRCGCQRRTQTR
jgi:hypothetical protein